MSRCEWCEVELPMRDTGYNPTRRRYCCNSHKQLAYIARKQTGPFVHDGSGPDVDPVTGDEAETFQPPD